MKKSIIYKKVKLGLQCSNVKRWKTYKKVVAIKTKAEEMLIFTQLNIQINLSTNVYEFIKELLGNPNIFMWSFTKSHQPSRTPFIFPKVYAFSLP